MDGGKDELVNGQIYGQIDVHLCPFETKQEKGSSF